MIVLAETNKIISKGHKRQGLSPTPIGNSLFAIYCGGRLCKITRQRRPIKVLKLPLCSWALPPFRFRKGTTTRLSLSRSDLIRFSIAYHRLFYYLFDIQIPSRNSSTRGDSFLSDKVVCNLIIIVFCHAEYITHTIVHMFPGCCIIIILI